MRVHKVSIDFIQGDRCIGTWTDYVPVDSDPDGLIDYLYLNKLVNVNWDRVQCIDRKSGKGDKLGWHKHYPPLQIKLWLMLAWLLVVFFAVVQYYEGQFKYMIVPVAWGWSWILYLGRGK